MLDCPPVLILAFNRPDSVAQLVRALAPVAPSAVYVAVDGPRASVRADAERCAQVREILSALPWPHRLETLLREHNLGCGPAVAEAIDWFFSHVDAGIILEDDVLPHPSMFDFMAAMLERYKHDERVMHISASNYAGVRASPASYFFSRYVSIWGWATWRRAWGHFRRDISGWRHSPDVLRQPGLGWRTRRYLSWSFDRAAAGLGNWDYQWKYAVIRNGLAVTPNFNLAVTTGFGDEATNLSKTGKVPPLQEMPSDLVHPHEVIADPDLDHAMYAEQLDRGEWYWEASRLLLPFPTLYHGIGGVLRAATRTATLARR